MGQCNCCLLRQIRKRTPKGQKIAVIYNARWGMGGVNVYRYPVGVKIPSGLKEDSPEHKKYFVAWMAKIPDRCSC